MKIEKETMDSGYQYIAVKHDNGAVITSSEVDSYILFAVLDKLEEIRCGLIDVEEAVNKLNPALNLTRSTWR